MPAEVEIKDDATREDVDAMVKEFMDERVELTSEGSETTTEDTSKQTTDGDDISATDDDAAATQTDAGSEDSTSTDDDDGGQADNWLTDEVRAELPRWLSDEDLLEFANRDELDRALGLFARAAVNADDDGRTSDGTVQQPQARSHEGGGDTAPEPYEIELDLSAFDDDLGPIIKDVLTGLRDHYDGRIGALNERFAELAASAEINAETALEAQFDRVVDSLGFAELFGKTGEESPTQLKARGKLLNHAVAFRDGPKPFGQEVTLEDATELMFRGLFSEDISKRELKNRTRRMQGQANMRTGVGAERPEEDRFQGPLKKHPDVRRAFKEYQESLGED